MPESIGDAVVLIVRAAVAPLQAELAALRATVAQLADVQKELTTLRERVAVAEVRQLVPGPAGAAGADGVGFDDLAVDFDGQRTLTLAFQRGAQTKRFPVTLPFLHYQGTYQDGQTYAAGDVVTHAGSAWHCHGPTAAKPGDGATDWQLMVKRGRDAYPKAG